MASWIFCSVTPVLISARLPGLPVATVWAVCRQWHPSIFAEHGLSFCFATLLGHQWEQGTPLVSILPPTYQMFPQLISPFLKEQDPAWPYFLHTAFGNGQSRGVGESGKKEPRGAQACKYRTEMIQGQILGRRLPSLSAHCHHTQDERRWGRERKASHSQHWSPSLCSVLSHWAT